MAFSTNDIKSSKRWENEITCQKVFGMTPSESRIYVARQDGYDEQEIASSEGLSLQTVRNTLTNARKKIKGEGEMQFYISKVYQIQNDSASAKLNLTLILAHTCKKLGYKVNMLNHLIVVSGLDRQVTGDIDWFKNNVERFVDFIGTRSEPMAEERATRIVDVYNDAREGEDKFGWAVLKYYLDHYYITYDINEVE